MVCGRDLVYLDTPEEMVCTSCGRAEVLQEEHVPRHPRAASFVAEHLGVIIPVQKEIACEFSDLNRECRREECRFYRDVPARSR